MIRFAQQTATVRGPRHTTLGSTLEVTRWIWEPYNFITIQTRRTIKSSYVATCSDICEAQTNMSNHCGSGLSLILLQANQRKYAIVQAYALSRH